MQALIVHHEILVAFLASAIESNRLDTPPRVKITGMDGGESPLTGVAVIRCHSGPSWRPVRSEGATTGRGSGVAQ